MANTSTIIIKVKKQKSGKGSRKIAKDLKFKRKKAEKKQAKV